MGKETRKVYEAPFKARVVEATRAMKASLAVFGLTSAIGCLPMPAVAAAPSQNQTQTHRISTDQMLRNFLETGSINHGADGSGPARHIVAITQKPLLQAVQQEARKFSGLNPSQNDSQTANRGLPLSHLEKAQDEKGDSPIEEKHPSESQNHLPNEKNREQSKLQ